MYNEDMPEVAESNSMNDILVSDLKARINSNLERIDRKVDVHDNPLTETQLENLKSIVHAQQLRLEKMLKK